MRKPRPQETHAPWRLLIASLAALLFAAWFLSRNQPPPPARPPPPGVANRELRDRSEAQIFGEYAGSTTCKECHSQAFQSWRGSHHALAERAVNPELDGSAFRDQRITHGSQGSHVGRAGTGFSLTTASPDGQTNTFALTRVIGVQPLRQFLVSGPNGRWQTTELAYDPVQNDWFDIFGSEDRKPGEWGHWTGRGMTWNQMCASCHNTRLRKNYDPASDSYSTSMAEVGVGCEACHGPSQAHVQWQKQALQPVKPGSDPTLRRLSPARMFDVCASCHARRAELTGEFTAGEPFLDHFSPSIPDETDLFYPDGQVRDELYEWTSFVSSRMHAAGVRCADCHEPHSATVRARDDSLCLRCHEGPIAPAPRIVAATHSNHQPNTPGGRCVDCHMPITVYMQRHPRRDHAFAIPDPLLTREHGIPNACNRCHQDKSIDWSLAAVEKWYGPRMDRPSRARARALADARAGRTNSLPHLVKLTREEPLPLWRASAARLLAQWCFDPGVKTVLLEKGGDADPLVRIQVAHALEPLLSGNDAGAVRMLTFLLEDKTRAVRLAAAWALRRGLVTNSLPGRDLARYLDFNSDQPAGALQLATFHSDRGNPKLALPLLQRAAAWDRHSAPLREALAVCLSILGQPREAVAELEAACRLAPIDAEYPFKLALALNETGALQESAAALERAVKLDPRHASAWYNLGLAYSALGREQEALDALVRAESVDHSSPRAPYARATILARLGSVPEARAAALRALELQPAFRDAAELLRQLGQDQ